MKPHELIAALMDREGLGPLPLAKRLGKPKLQSPIHRFWRGDVSEPARSTAEALSGYFKIPMDAIYDEKVASRIAKERGLVVVKLPPPRPRAGTSFARPIIARIMAKIERGEGPDEDAPAAEREFHRVVQAAMRGLLAAAPDGPSASTRPGDFDALPAKKPKNKDA